MIESIEKSAQKLTKNINIRQALQRFAVPWASCLAAYICSGSEPLISLFN
jgi:hypothetical protein